MSPASILLSLLMLASTTATEWSTATSRNDALGRTMVFRYASGFAQGFKRSEQPFRVVIVWSYTSENGLPSLDERKRMDLLEDRMEPLLEADEFATLALVSTGENTREWVYYAKSEDGFMTRFNSAAQGESFPLQLHSASDPTWSTYQTFVDGVVAPGV